MVTGQIDTCACITCKVGSGRATSSLLSDNNYWLIPLISVERRVSGREILKAHLLSSFAFS